MGLTIAMFAWESLSTVAVGGVAPHVSELASSLERQGHEVHVYARTGEHQSHYEIIFGVHVHRVPFQLNPDFVQECSNMCDAMVHFALETEGFMGKRFDIFHAHDWLAAPALMNIKHNHNRPCVFTIHSTEYGRCGNKTFYEGISGRIRHIEERVLQYADRVIAVSGVLCDEVKSQYNFDHSKLRRVHNGINCLAFDKERVDVGQLKQNYGIGPVDPMVLFVGRLATQKGPDLLIEAIPDVLSVKPDAKFFIVGDGHLRSHLEYRCSALHIHHAVKFLGSMSGTPLIDLFHAADVCVVPSRNEPFGIVTLEAWASKTAVVATKSGGPREIVTHGEDGYLVDTDVGGIAWGLKECFGNFDHLRYMGEKGRGKAAFYFSWDAIGEQTRSIYQEIL